MEQTDKFLFFLFLTIKKNNEHNLKNALNN